MKEKKPNAEPTASNPIMAPTRETLLQEAQEKAKQTAEQLSEQLRIKVHPLVFFPTTADEPCIGYVKEPSRAVKLAVMDKSLSGMYSAASEALEVTLLKEHSDTRIYSERSEDDIYYMGAVMAVYELIQFSVNVFDKKK